MMLFMLPLGIILGMMAIAFLKDGKWWSLPLFFILGYLAYQCFASTWLFLEA